MRNIANTNNRKISIAALQEFGCDWIGEARQRSTDLDIDIEDLLAVGDESYHLFDQMDGFDETYH